MIKLRERVNAITHYIGGILSIIGTILLITTSINKSPVNITIARIVFGISMMLLYFTSATYHSINGPDSKILVFRKLDHSMIFVLIAGSYTPVLMSSLSGKMRYITLISIWIVAIAGILFRVFYLNAPRILYTLSYLVLGWVAIFFIMGIYKSLGLVAVLLLAGGGIMYSIGAVIYAFKKPNIFKKFGFHEIFHIFIMLGTLCHYMMVYLYIK